MNRNTLHHRLRQNNETLAEYAEELKRLAHLAHPQHPIQIRDEFAGKQFIEGLGNNAITRQLVAERIESSQPAVERASEFETIFKLWPEKDQTNGKENSKRRFESTILDPGESFSNKETKITCYNCNRLGHYADIMSSIDQIK
uniref:CCHC-type domain-containing protein n=1 Tax=Bracon brevicornis TaxID=1563983 RepID=A0A6V7JMG8_9HYME